MPGLLYFCSDAPVESLEGPLTCFCPQIGDAYLVASGILAQKDGFWTIDTQHDARLGAGRMVALAVDMLRTAHRVRSGGLAGWPAGCVHGRHASWTGLSITHDR